MNLPDTFIEYTRELMGEERFNAFLSSFDGTRPVSIRLNPFKPFDASDLLAEAQRVEWCKDGYFLKERPDFTLDPLLHAGCYYVQEAGSMFIDRVIRQYVDTPVKMLDLCAAPGGKSTLCRAALPEGSLLYSNEPDRRRANILMENLQKQGHPDVVVTNNFAIDYQRQKMNFDIILCDVPCSGEGMFRKDAGAIAEWSMQNVIKCRDLQRSIIEDIWPCLREGGLLIYSTCTFNAHENEENIEWICKQFEATTLPVEISSDWKITGALTDFDGYVYRFIPGITSSEGLFVAVLRKGGSAPSALSNNKNLKASKKSFLREMCNGHYSGTQKGRDIIPDQAEALLYNLATDKYPRYELTREEALSYLRHESIILSPDTPRGFVVVTYKGKALGFVKNIGNRANNLYPQEWRIKNK